MKFGIWDFGRASARFLIFAMARYEHLPIYKAALDLTVHLEKLVAGFSRYHKYTLGTEMREGSRAVLMQVLKANNAANANHHRDEQHEHGAGAARRTIADTCRVAARRT